MKLFAGPWIGELGWELFGWQAYIRTLSKDYDEVIVSSRPGHELLYEDFCDRFVPYDPGSWNCSFNRCFIERKDWWVLHHNYISLSDQLLVGILSKQIRVNGAQFISFGSYDKSCNYDVIIHARNCNDGYKNWPLDNWKCVCEALLLKVACVGISGFAYPINFVDQKMDLNLRELANLLASSRVIVGPSSGPMHFATLCNCPQIVWFDDSKNCILPRYKKKWNPFNVSNVVIDNTWQPGSNEIIDKVLKFLK